MQQVRQGQVEVEGRRGGVLGPELQEGQDVGVGGDSDQHGQDVGERYDLGAEDPRGVGRHRVVRVNVQPRCRAGGGQLREIQFVHPTPESLWL